MDVEGTYALALQGYPLGETAIEVAGRCWVVAAVEDQDALVARVQTDEDLERFPYGLMLWASAVGLAERLAEEPSLVRGKTVVELGAGAGLPGLVARHLGAQVTQTDYHEDALALARLNAARNGVSGIRYALADWRHAQPVGRYDVVLGSDILYERSLHDPLRALLPALSAPDGLVLLSDPVRPQALDFVDRLERDGFAVEMDSTRVDLRGERREVALFSLRF